MNDPRESKKPRLSFETTQDLSHGSTLVMAKNMSMDGNNEVSAEQDEKASFGLPGKMLTPCGYEYLDHTADIQIHAWGTTLENSFEQAVLGMFGYMTELKHVEIDDTATMEFEAEGHDMLSLLFNLMDEFLFRFVTEPFVVCSQIKILEFNREDFKIRVQGLGEVFDLDKHPQGTEIKAVTYSNMQIHHDQPTNDIYVIVDI
eukprot:m.56837 g.56837  ORF g.56837 m.56837 type:complete len:202 (+) comp15596_c0_seq2:98-703(+)